MPTNIIVRELSRPTLTFQLLKGYRDESAGDDVPVDITGHVFKLIVKQGTDLPDARAYFDLQGTIVLAANGTYKFELTLEHTGLAPADYPAEIRWWADGDTTKPPTDFLDVVYSVVDAVDDVV